MTVDVDMWDHSQWGVREPTYRDPTRSINIGASVGAMACQHAEGCVKITEDLARYRALIRFYKPDLVIELGTFSGKSAAWFARETGAPVITVDTRPWHDYEADPNADGVWDGLGVTQIVGSSTDASVVELVHALAGGAYAMDEHPYWPITPPHPGRAQRPLLILDSDHTGAHVLAEMEAYHDLIPKWGYMVVEDGILRYNEHEHAVYEHTSPLDAIEAFQRAHTGWSSDKDLEYMFPVTQHPEGWLVRRA